MMMKLHFCPLRYKNKDCEHHIRCFGSQAATDLSSRKQTSQRKDIFCCAEINPISDRRNLEMKQHLSIVRSGKQRGSDREMFAVVLPLK